MSIEFQHLRQRVQWLRSEDGVVPEDQALEVLSTVIEPLFEAEGFRVSRQHGSDETGVDLVATGSEDNVSHQRIGIEYKHRGLGKPIDLETVQYLLGRGIAAPYDRLMLIGRFGFTSEAREAARQTEPVSIELLDLLGIEEWIDRVETGPSSSASEVQFLVRSISHEFATLVAGNPRTLDHLEWRDLERMMDRVMTGLGFRVTLTPPSKDQGKDLILNCTVDRGDESYIVELKHWRSGKRVGKQAVSDFLQVMIGENRKGGLFLSTSGYADNAFEELSEFTRQHLRMGGENKIVLLAQTYVKACSGLWSPPTELSEVLFQDTL